MAKPVRNLYELVPVQRRTFDENDDGTVDVLLPRYGEGRVGRLMKRVLSREPVRVHLDDVGTSVWHLCDGERSVQEIAESLHEKFGSRIEPVYDRLEMFLEQMRTSGLIEWKTD
jgi:hypothetical protein